MISNFLFMAAGLLVAAGGYFLVKWSAKTQKKLIEKQKSEKKD